MTVSNQNQKSTATGNGSSHQFTFNFKIALAADLVVLVRTDTTGATVTKVLNTDYIIPTSSIGADNGGNILFKFDTGTNSDAHFDTTDRRPPAGTTVILKRQVQLTQGVDLQAASSLPAETLENAYDKVTHGLQQLQEQMDRALLRPASDSASAALPDTVDLKGKVLQFNSSTGVPEAVAGLTNTATSSSAGLMSAADKSKIDGIEASADVTDATNVNAAGAVMNADTSTAQMQFVVDEDNMASNTATKIPTQQSVKAYVDSQVQTKDALSELSGDLDDISDGSNHVKMTNAERTKLTGVEDNATADQNASEIRALVESATDSNVFTDADHTKLNAIEAGATADQTDAEIKTAYENNSDTNAFSDAEKTKLTGIETGATADQDASEIRTLVESATNSNVFTDADHTKLNNIENNATADQTDSEIRALVASATDSNVFTDADHTKLDGIETGATADQNASDIRGLGFFDVSNDGTGSGLDADLLDGQQGTYYQAASTALTTSTNFAGDVSGSYNEIVIADDSHNHVISNVDNLQTSLDAKAPLASPALTGTPTAPTASADTSTTQVATTAFVQQELTALVDSAPNTLNTLNEIAAAINDDPNFNTTVTNSLGNRLRIDVNNQSLTATQKSNATTNLGLSAVATSGAYSDISGTPSAATTSAAGLMSAADKTKIDGIESNATADQTASEIKTLYENNSNTNALTDALLSKLNAIEASATADQTASEIRTLVESANDSNVFTNADHSKLNAIEENATADQTAAEIRTLVESATDSNVFTDADHSKLNAIEASATADQTAAEIRALVESATDSNVFTDNDHSKLNAIEANATADQTAADIRGLGFFDTSNDGATSGLDSDLLDGQHGSHYLDYNNFTNVPTLTTTLSALTDTTITSVGNNDLIAYDSSSSKFINQTPAEAGFATVATSGAYSDLSGTPTIPSTLTDLTLDLNGNELILDLDGDTSITSDTDDEIHFKIGGTDELVLDFGYLRPHTDQGLNLGSAGRKWLYLYVNQGNFVDINISDQVNSQVTSKAPFIIASTIKVANLNVDKLDDQEGSYYLDYTNFSNTPTIPTAVSDLTNDAGFITSVPAQSFASLTGKPTTISGYGITDALSNIADVTGGVSVTGDLTLDEVFLANSTDHKIGKVNHTYGDGIGLTTDNATVTIGAGNSSYIHYISSGGQQHWFNTHVNANGNFYVYSDAGSLTWINNRGTTHEVTLTTTTPSAARTITLPDATGTVPVFTTAPTGAIADGTNGQVLSTDGAGTLSFTTVSGGSSGLSNLVEDESPQLGGDLDTNAFTINMDDQKAINFNSGSYYGFINYNSTFNPYGNSNGTMTVGAFGAPLRLSSVADSTYVGSQFSASNTIETNNTSSSTPLIVRTNTGSATDNLFKIDYQGTATFEKGVVDIKNDGSQSEVRLYCESANEHYAALKAPAHADIPGNVTLTLPATTGTLLSTASNLNDLSNVSVASPSNGQVLKYISAESRWEAADETGGGGGSATNADTVDNLHLSVVSTMPSSPNSSTIYFVTG